MRTRTKISVGLLAAATLGLIVFLALNSEPHYKGRSLSQWLTISRASNAAIEQREEAADAVRRLSTNALPLLLKWATTDPTQKKTKIQSWLGKVPASLVPRTLRKWVDTPPDQTRADEAKLGFIILGADAAPAIPQLARLAKKVPPHPSTYWAITALGNIGPTAFPTLLKIAEDPTIPWKRAAVREIGKFGTNALPALPAIIRLLDDADPQTAYDSAVALGDLSLSPELSIPAPTRCLQRPNPFLRVAASKSITRFGPHARAAIPEIEKAESTTTEPFAKLHLQFILRDIQRKPEMRAPQ